MVLRIHRKFKYLRFVRAGNQLRDCTLLGAHVIRADVIRAALAAIIEHREREH